MLEIGCVGMGKHDILGGSNFIAGYVKPLTKRWLAIDVNEDGIREMMQHGFDLRKINAEEPFDLHEQFDVILAEEVVEQLTRSYLINGTTCFQISHC